MTIETFGNLVAWIWYCFSLYGNEWYHSVVTNANISEMEESSQFQNSNMRV